MTCWVVAGAGDGAGPTPVQAQVAVQDLLQQVVYCTVLYCTVLYLQQVVVLPLDPRQSLPLRPPAQPRHAPAGRDNISASMNATKIFLESQKYLCVWYLRRAPAMCQPDSVLLLAPEPCLLLSAGLLNSDLLLLASWGPWTRCRRSMVAAAASNCNQWDVLK